MQRSITPDNGKKKKKYEKDFDKEFQEIARAAPKIFQPYVPQVLSYVKKIIHQMRENDYEINELRKQMALVRGLKTEALKEFQRKEEIDLKYDAKRRFNKTQSKLRLEERRTLVLNTLGIRIESRERQNETLGGWIEEFLTPQTRTTYLKLLWASKRLEGFGITGNSTTAVDPVDWDNQERTSSGNWQEASSQRVFEILKKHEGQFVIFYGGSLIRNRGDNRLAILEEVTRGKIINSESEWYIRGKFYWLENNCYLDSSIPKLNVREPYFGSYRFMIFEKDFYKKWLIFNSNKS